MNASGGAATLLRRAVAPGILAGFFLLLYLEPFGLRWPCPVRTALGIPCPTCGMTRAARLVAHGDLAGANHLHPLWVLVLPLLAALLLAEAGHYLRSGAWGGAGRLPAIRVLGLGTAVLLVLVWIARFFGAFGGPVPV